MAEMKTLRYQKILMYQPLGIALILIGVLATVYVILFDPGLFFRGLSLGTVLVLSGIIILLVVDTMTTKLEKRY